MTNAEAPTYPVNLTIALTYIQELQERRPDLYPHFLELLSEYRTPPRSLGKLRLQVKELMKDEPELLAKV